MSMRNGRSRRFSIRILPQGAHADVGAIEADGTVIFQNGFDPL